MAVMMRSMLEVADNSGARKLQMILPLGGATGLRASLGDVITASVKEAAPDGQVQKGKVVKADPFKGKSTPVSTGSIALVWQIERDMMSPYQRSVARKGRSSSEDACCSFSL